MLSMPDAGCKLCISSEHRGERPSQSVFCLSVCGNYIQRANSNLPTKQSQRAEQQSVTEHVSQH